MGGVALAPLGSRDPLSSRGGTAVPVVAHPGPTSPPPPAVRFEVPDPWVSTPAGDALLRVAGPGSAGDPVEVEVRQVVAPEGIEAAVLVDGSAGHAGGGGGVVEEPFVVEIAGREWVARNVSWSEDAGPVVEVHLATTLAPAVEGVVSRHVHVVGRVRGSGLDADYDALQGVLETLVVEGGEG